MAINTTLLDTLGVFDTLLASCIYMIQCLKDTGVTGVSNFETLKL